MQQQANNTVFSIRRLSACLPVSTACDPGPDRTHLMKKYKRFIINNVSVCRISTYGLTASSWISGLPPHSTVHEQQSIWQIKKCVKPAAYVCDLFNFIKSFRLATSSCQFTLTRYELKKAVVRQRIGLLEMKQRMKDIQRHWLETFCKSTSAAILRPSSCSPIKSFLALELAVEHGLHTFLCT